MRGQDIRGIVKCGQSLCRQSLAGCMKNTRVSFNSCNDAHLDQRGLWKDMPRCLGWLHKQLLLVSTRCIRAESLFEPTNL
ncbi:Calcium-transporting ATPase 2 [Fusarium oxysporum f. sp. albedinis]|nr:Calcium-transporting ATPase 2 [Fusarium oxysporum f. sp. albedinis]